jgi:hypothetical protein
MNQQQIFEFERSFTGSFRCIPMIVRFSLDRVGIKLTLRQWSRIGRSARHQLVHTSCDTPDEVAAYRALLIQMIESRADEPVKVIDIDMQPEWRRVDRVPDRVINRARAGGLEPPSLSFWSACTPLQRFALYKLTRVEHDNDNFEPALCEFMAEAAIT